MSQVWQAAQPTDHWHLIGQRWRPLDEQLTGLRDAATWMSVSAHADSLRPGPIGPVSVSPGLAMTSGLHCAKYGLIVVSGDLTRADVLQVRAQLHAILLSGAHHLVVDLADVRATDPRLGLALDLVHRRLHARGGTLTVVGVPSAVSLGPADGSGWSSRRAPGPGLIVPAGPHH